jgi:hypothetical protein
MWRFENHRYIARENPVTKEEMAAVILQVIDRSYDPTMAEIMRALGAEAQGQLDWELLPNTVIWSGMSDLAIDAFASIHDLIEPLPPPALLHA